VSDGVFGVGGGGVEGVGLLVWGVRASGGRCGVGGGGGGWFFAGDGVVRRGRGGVVGGFRV